MRVASLALAAMALAPSALALPFMNLTSRAEHTHEHTHAAEESGAEWTYPIHESCNGSQSLQLKKTLQDMVTLADYARTTLLDNGGEGELEKQYFGEGDIAAAIGYYSRIVRGSDKVLFRCDDPDGNCQLTDYYGHWRGDNATDETVICEKSFQGRRPLEQTCGFGFQLGTDKPSTIWPVDVLHRVMHLPSIVSDRIAHVADTYADVLELASTHPEFAVSNQLTLQLYAIDSWSRANVVEGGCVGAIGPAAGLTLDGDAHGGSSSSTSASVAPSSSSSAAAASSTSSSAAAAAQTSAPAPEAAQQGASQSDCHLHADGTVHCGAH